MPTLRHASSHDLEAILSIYNDAILNTTSVYHYKAHTLSMREEWFATKQRDGWPVIVADSGGIISGFATFGPFRPWPAYKYCVENSLYVSPAFRNQGHGKLLLAELINLAGSMQKHSMVAAIDASNVASLKLHKSFGFKEVGHFPQIGYKFNRWLDLKFLQLILSTPLKPQDG